MITYKIRVYPTEEQKVLFDKMLWEAKNLYNWMLQCTLDTYDSCKIHPNKFDLEVFRKQYRCQYLGMHIQQNMQTRLVDAFKRFFSGQNGFPKFKSIRRFRSLTAPEVGRNGCKLFIEKQQISFIRLGRLRAVFDRPIVGKPKICTIKKMPSGKYYAFVVSDTKGVPNVYQRKSDTVPSVGVDPGISNFVTLSDGKYLPRPIFFRLEQKKLLRAHRKLSRKKFGSNNYEKARIRFAKIHEKISERRRDFHFKVAKELVTTYDTIYIEKLETSFMMKKKTRKDKQQSKLVSDIALYSFFCILHHMANKYKSKIIDVDPYQTTQMCSRCGTIVQKGLEVRTHVCPVCGISIDRDLNAAINILHRGLPERSTEGSSGTTTLVEMSIPGL